MIGSHASHISPYSNIDTHSVNTFPSTKGTQSYVAPITVSSAPLRYNVIEKSDIHSHSGYNEHGINRPHDIGCTASIGKTYPYSSVSTHYEKVIPTTIPRTIPSVGHGRDFSSADSVVFRTGPLSAETEVLTKPNFVIQPIVETIQKPEFLVQENVLGVIQKPEFVIQEFSEVLSKPEFVIQEEVVGTVVKPTYVVQEQVSVVQKPEYAIEEDVEFIVKPEFQIQEFTEVISKPTFVVEENVVAIQKPTFAIQSSQEVIQKPDIVIASVPVTVRKPDYQIAENIIPVAKPAFFVQETQETVIKPEFVVTEEVVPVPRPNFLVQEQVQIVEKPNFQVQDVVQTVQKPEYSVQESTVVVQKPEFFIEEVTETVVRPSFVEQEVAETVISPHYVVQDELVTVTRPQFVVEETLVPVVKPEFFVEEVSEIVQKPQYVVEDVAVAVEKPTYVLVDTPVVVPKPNYVIEETVETVAKPEYNIEERVEVIQKPEFVIQDRVVATIQKPKFIVVSSSNPSGKEFNAEDYLKSGGSPSAEAEPVFIDRHNDVHMNLKSAPEPRPCPTGNSHHIPLAEPSRHHHGPHAQSERVIIPPSLRPQIIEGVEEFIHPVPVPEFVQKVPVVSHPVPVAISHPVPLPEFHEHSVTPLHRTFSGVEVDEIVSLPSTIHAKTVHNHASSHSAQKTPILRTEVIEVTPKVSSQQAHHHSRTTSVVPVNHHSNNIHGLQVLGKKLGYEVRPEPNDFKAPKLKVKKNTDISEEEELFEWLYGQHDLVENGQYYLELGIPHPKYGYLLQDQEGRPKLDDSNTVKTDIIYADNLEGYDDCDSTDDILIE